MPQFFIPQVEPDKWEEAYQQIAAFIGAAAAPDGSRIYSITWKHDNAVWTATVGEQLRGVATISKGRGRDRREITAPRSSDDTVLAIFRGVPFLIAHDNRSRRWNLPILAGNPSAIVPFSA